MTEKFSGEGDFGKMKPKMATLKSIGVTNQALMVSNWKYSLQIPFTANWKLQSGRDKETSINVIASYCPFCGVEMEKSSNS